jgi:hypothetical protein
MGAAHAHAHRSFFIPLLLFRRYIYIQIKRDREPREKGSATTTLSAAAAFIIARRERLITRQSVPPLPLHHHHLFLLLYQRVGFSVEVLYLCFSYVTHIIQGKFERRETNKNTLTVPVHCFFFKGSSCFSSRLSRESGVYGERCERRLHCCRGVAPAPAALCVVSSSLFSL